MRHHSILFLWANTCPHPCKHPNTWPRPSHRFSFCEVSFGWEGTLATTSHARGLSNASDTWSPALCLTAASLPFQNCSIVLKRNSHTSMQAAAASGCDNCACVCMSQRNWKTKLDKMFIFSYKEANIQHESGTWPVLTGANTVETRQLHKQLNIVIKETRMSDCRIQHMIRHEKKSVIMGWD